MIKKPLILLLLPLIFSCKSKNQPESPYKPASEYTIAFGSCNKTELKNYLWDDIADTNPDIWIWGGDNIYADTDDMGLMAKMYQEQRDLAEYRKLRKAIPVTGCWDDHDYGINDGGVEWPVKRQSQQAFLNFMDVPGSDPRRTREGIYTVHKIVLPVGSLTVFILDTRYFRTGLTPDSTGEKRYVPNAYGEGTILGEVQWDWLEEELTRSKTDFNLLVSSIQFLSDQHGFETWGNFPHEVERLKKMIVDSGAKGVFILSGDRHISEFSKADIDDLAYPIIDFTSSGLTHAYSDFSGEPNPYRLGEVVSTESFGLVNISFTKKLVRFQIIGDEGRILGELEQQY